MSDNKIFLPRRIANTLREIYKRRVTVVCAPDGTGKSTLLREFTRRSRPDGFSLRFIKSAESSGDCFAQICALITGEALEEPLTDGEYAALREKFIDAAPGKPMIIIVDCAAAEQTLFGNLRTAKLLAECGCAKFTFVCSSIKPGYRTLAQRMNFLLIEREQLCMNISEIAEYAGRCGVTVNSADIYSSCRGTFLGTRLCFMLAQQNKSFLNSTTEGRLIRAVIQPGSIRLQGALMAAAACPSLSVKFFRDLQSFTPVTDFFGTNIFTLESVIDEMEKLRSIIPLVEINRRTHEIHIHPVLIHAAYTVFFWFPINVQHDMRICFAREYQRNGQDFFAFCEYFLAGEYELAASHSHYRISYSMLIKSSRLLQRFVQSCPLECKPAIPSLMRIITLLMHTEAKPTISGKFAEIIAHLASSPDYEASERRVLTGYAYALRTNEDFYILDKMGDSIKRAYDLFKRKREYESPLLPWTMYSPSVFCLLHRRGYSLQTENEQFIRYQNMYTEMLGHGKYTQIVFTGEMKCYQGDLSGGLELLSAAASLCSSEKNTATRLAALFSAAKCCLYLGNYKQFFSIIDEIHGIERSHINSEEGESAKLCLGMLRTMRGGEVDDMWYALSTEDSDIMYNHYTAPYFVMTRAAYMLTHEKYSQLSDSADSFINTAAAAGNELAGIKLRLYCAQSFLSLGNHENAIRLFSEAVNSAIENYIPTALAEICAVYPEIFTQLYPLVSDALHPAIDRAKQMGEQFRRGIEAVRTYEITYLCNTNMENFAERYLAPLRKLMESTEKLRTELGLSKAAYSYAIMAASGLSNAEISNLFNVSENSIKSSLKRTCSALGSKNRRGLIGIIPTLK